MEEHDALADRHRAGAPREDGLALRELGDAEEAKAIEQRGDVAAGDRDGLAVVDDRRRSRSRCSRDGGALEGLVARVELAAIAGAAIEVERVDVADRVDRRARLVLEDVVGRGALIDDVLRRRARARGARGRSPGGDGAASGARGGRARSSVSLRKTSSPRAWRPRLTARPLEVLARDPRRRPRAPASRR